MSISEKVLLIGNGLNNIKQNYKWSDLINELINYIGAGGQISIGKKPFPMLYEEIFIEANKNRGFSEDDIKIFIAEKVSNLEVNDIHRKILDLQCLDILTTNYDLTFESILCENPIYLSNDGYIKETKYSIFRHFTIDETKIWHIHGVATSHASIMLGYEQYIGYLQKIRDYIVSGTNYEKNNFDPLITRIPDIKVHGTSWLDYFFTRNVYIMGLNLDYPETHLWWLFTYRQREIIKKKIPITNKIFYFYPLPYADSLNDKLKLFASVGVIPYSVDLKNDDWISYYSKVLNLIKKL